MQQLPPNSTIFPYTTLFRSKILPMAKIPDEQRSVALDLVYDRRREGYDPLNRFMELFEGVSTSSAKAGRAEELAALDRKSTRLNSSHANISYAVFCLKKKTN